MKGFIKDCLFFQGEEPLFKFIGVWVWLDLAYLIIKSLELIYGN
jgi:hypothetical protein